MSSEEPGLSNLTPLLAARYLDTLPFLAAYCISAPIISVLLIILSSGAFFSSSVPKANGMQFLIGIVIFIVLWIVPGFARKGGTILRLIIMGLCAVIFYRTRNPLILFNIFIVSSIWWWWLLFKKKHWTILSLWGHIPKLIIFAATVFLSLDIIK